MELATPETSDELIALLVSMPSVRMTIALWLAGRSESRRAVAAVASYSDVLPKGRRSSSAPPRSVKLLVNEWRSWSDESNVKTATSSSPCRSWPTMMSNAWRAIAIFGPTRMLPLMSTRIARLTAEVWSDRSERIGRGSPLSRTSKSAVVKPFTGRPRRSLTDAWMLTRSTELRNVACGLCTGAWATRDAPASVVTAVAVSTIRWTYAFIDVPPRLRAHERPQRLTPVDKPPATRDLAV